MFRLLKEPSENTNNVGEIRRDCGQARLPLRGRCIAVNTPECRGDLNRSARPMMRYTLARNVGRSAIAAGQGQAQLAAQWWGSPAPLTNRAAGEG
jgi:hypothetical protein